jgi:hypothetical protein
MKRILTVLLLLSGGGAARAVPVVPNFTQGSMTSHTETTSTVQETINSMDYNTGWQYVVTGTNVDADGGTLTPIGAGSITNTNVTLDGVTSTWNGLNLTDRPEFNMTVPGAAFQFTESYQGPGLSNHTIIQRNTTVTSVTDTTSTFSQ